MLKRDVEDVQEISTITTTKVYSEYAEKKASVVYLPVFHSVDTFLYSDAYRTACFANRD